MTNVNSKVMEGSTSADKVPLSALRNATRSLISSMLNPCKILPSPSKYPRDYRGLAYLCNLPLPPCNSCDSTASVLKSWEKLSNPTVADFISALETIDRWDVIDDIEELLSKDLEQYSQIGSEPQELSNPLNSETDQHILTVDDVLRIEKGLEPQFYDAFLLYSDEDVDFATQMIDRLENHYELKLCIKERDLVGGVTFEHEAIMRLISERCRRVILIISPSFIESPANRFFVNYSQALGIEQSQRKIIPCVYKPTSLPRLLTYYTRLDFNRTSPLWNFWDKLTASIRSPLPGETSRNVVQSSVKITELPDPIQWDCPEKSARRLPSLPAIGEGDARAASNPKTDVCLPRGSEPVELSQATKSKTFSLTNLLPSPPTNKLKKMKWWKKKKVRVPEASSF